MFFFLSKVLDVLLSPHVWAAGLLLAAVPWTARAARRWRRKRLFGIAGGVLVLLFSSEPVANALSWWIEHEAPSTYHDDVTYDAVVLLGGVSDERVLAATGTVAYNDNVERLLVTYGLLREGKAKVAIVSGAAMDPSLERFGEARVMVEQLERWGIDRSRLVVEDRARNTRENAVYSAEIIRARGLSRILVVTSAFHMPRSIECFRAVDLPIDTLAVDYRGHQHRSSWLPRTQHLHASSSIVREVAGRFIYRVQGYGRAR